jgi:hypothetical protein
LNSHVLVDFEIDVLVRLKREGVERHGRVGIGGIDVYDVVDAAVGNEGQDLLGEHLLLGSDDADAVPPFEILKDHGAEKVRFS